MYTQRQIFNQDKYLLLHIDTAVNRLQYRNGGLDFLASDGLWFMNTATNKNARNTHNLAQLT